MKNWLKMIALASLLFTGNLLASSLTEPKQAGLIGERFDGYLGLVNQSASADVKALVAEVNQKRKQRYQEISANRQQPLNKVELIAGETAIEKTEAGHYIFLKDKGWVKK